MNSSFGHRRSSLAVLLQTKPRPNHAMLRLSSDRSYGKISFGWLVPQFWGATGGQLPGGPTESMPGSYESARYSTSLGQAGSAMEPSFFFLRRDRRRRRRERAFTVLDVNDSKKKTEPTHAQRGGRGGVATPKFGRPSSSRNRRRRSGIASARPGPIHERPVLMCLRGSLMFGELRCVAS